MSNLVSMLRIVWYAPKRIKFLFLFCLALLVIPPIAFYRHQLRKYQFTWFQMRSTASAIESYAVDNAWYPGWAIGPDSIHAPLPASHPAAALPSFHQPTHLYPFTSSSTPSFKWAPSCLTTPFPYLASYPRDPYARRSKHLVTFVYYCNIKRGFGWILVSPGPDGDYDIKPFSHYDATLMPSQQTELILRTYDPTNGLFSNGDLCRVKQ